MGGKCTWKRKKNGKVTKESQEPKRRDEEGVAEQFSTDEGILSGGGTHGATQGQGGSCNTDIKLSSIATPASNSAGVLARGDIRCDLEGMEQVSSVNTVRTKHGS